MAKKKAEKPTASEKPRVRHKNQKSYWGDVAKKEWRAKYFTQHGYLPPEPWYESEDSDDADG